MYKNISRQRKQTINLASIKLESTSKTIYLSGDWNWLAIDEAILKPVKTNGGEWIVDGSQIQALDTTGSYFISCLIKQLTASGAKLKQLILAEEENKLYHLTCDLELGAANAAAEQERGGLVTRIGRWLNQLQQSTVQMIAFFGQLCQTMATIFKKEYSLYVQGIVETISSAGIQGILISSLLCFLIGVNLTYQMAPQFVTYGANVYVVNFLGISLLREVTPLLTAIIVAGRTGSAIASSIGSMKMQEEIDALQTMGISPMRRLVVPRVLGLIFSLPILTMLADVASMVGGMIFAGPLLDVDMPLFLSRLQTYVSINNFWVGIVKSFFFAWIIGMVGCFCGFQVKANADSIGQQTTRSVVLSICLIITVDALFAILFKFLGV